MKITHSNPASDFFTGVLDDLRSEKIDAPTSKSIRKAAAALEDDSIVSLDTLEDLGLPPGPRANFVFELINKRQPDAVKEQLRSATELAGVLEAVLSPNGTDWTEGSPIDDRLHDFFDSVYIDALETRSGLESITDYQGLGLEDVDWIHERVRLTDQDGYELTFHRVGNQADGEFVFSSEDGEDDRPLGHLSIRSLERLIDTVAPVAAEGAEHPLLSSLRKKQDEKEGGLLEGLLEAARDTLEAKLTQRSEQLEAVNDALKKHLKKHTVSEAPPSRIDEAVQALIDKTKRPEE